MAARLASTPAEVPVHQQAIDIIPAAYNRGAHDPKPDLMTEVEEREEKRTEITKSARDARRKAIKEANFLGGL